MMLAHCGQIGSDRLAHCGQRWCMAMPLLGGRVHSLARCMTGSGGTLEWTQHAAKAWELSALEAATAMVAREGLSRSLPMAALYKSCLAGLLSLVVRGAWRNKAFMNKKRKRAFSYTCQSWGRAVSYARH
jgi:hypothetical protein